MEQIIQIRPQPIFLLLPLRIHRRFTFASFRHSIYTVGARLVRHSTIALEPNELILETRARWQIDRGRPGWARRRVLFCGQRRCGSGVPAPELRDRAYNLDGLTNRRGRLGVERHSDGRCRARTASRRRYCGCFGRCGWCRRFARRWRVWRSATRSGDLDVGTGQVDLRRLVRVPLEGEQRVVRGIVRNFDLRANSVPASDAGIARVDRCIVDATALAAFLEASTGEPVIAPAGLALLTVRVVSASLARNVGALECSGFEAFFGCLLLSFGGQIARGQELVYECLVLADAVCEHAAMIAVVVDTPLDIDRIAGGVRDDWL